MKHRKSDWIQLAVLAFLGGSVILSLLLPQISGLREKPPLAEVTVLVRGSDSGLWSNARLGMEQAAKEFGAELRFLTLTTANDAAEQEGLLRREAENGADALVLVPADPAALKGRLTELTGSRPVVTMESEVEGAALTITPDNAALGRELAQALLEDWTGGKVLLLDTAPESEGISIRLEAAQIVLEEAGVPVQWRRAQVEELDKELPSLAEETDAGWIMAFEPAATERAASVKEGQGLLQALYGVGATNKIAAGLERGTISAITAWNDYAAGYLAVRSGLSAARGSTDQVGPLPFFVVRGEDMYEPEMQKLLFPVMG